MSLSYIGEVYERFLASPDAEVIAIKGGWGVGKTYHWNNMISKESVACSSYLKRYSYVSLFGVDSLESLKYKIFESCIDIEYVKDGVNDKTLNKNMSNLWSRYGKKGIFHFRNIPATSGYFSMLESFLFTSATNMIICLDDIERRGKNLSILDIMGLVSLLKEQKSCKVVMLLNSSQQYDEDYDKYKEKVVDQELDFLPLPKESSEIAFNSSLLLDDLLAKASIKLGITNIRVLQLIKRRALIIEEIIGEESEEVNGRSINYWCFLYGVIYAMPLMKMSLL